MAADEDQKKVKLSRISMVAPAIPTVKHRMFLSGNDIACIPLNNVKALLFYKTPEKEFSTIIKKLKRSLSLVLVDFYPFAGRLDTKGGESGRPEIDCNDGGVEFVEASIDMAFQDVETDDFQQKSFFKELLRTRQQIDEESLLSIQVTDFKGNGFCMGASFHHVIVDGNSFWYFMKCWAERSRGLPISKSPHHMRTVFKREKENYSIPNISLRAEALVTDRIKEAEIFRPIRDDLMAEEYSKFNVIPDENSIIPKTMKEETKLEASTFEFSQNMIQDLKERSGASTSFVAVAAQFWRCVMKAREVPEKEPVYFATPADCRGRVKPPLPPTYFGNCICMCIARTTAKNLLEQDICFAAGLIQELINFCTSEDQINSHLDWYESHVGSNGVMGSYQNLFGGYAVVTSMSPKFPVYETDHGWGRPLGVQTVFRKGIGKMVLFPGRGKRGTISVSTLLPHHQMETLKRILMIISD